MNRKQHIYLLLGLAMYLSACQPDVPPKVYQVPEIIQPYVDLFEQEAASRGLNITVDNLIVEFGTELNNGEAAGLCRMAHEGEPPKITLDSTSNNWQGSDASREILVFHELGHCILDRLHRDDVLPNGNLVSLMRSTGQQVYGGTLNAFKRDYYLDELFNTASPIPEWALLAPDYYEIDPSQKTDIFYDPFDNNEKNWALGSSTTRTAKIEDGHLVFGSKTSSHAFYLPRAIGIDPNGDFEIEVKMQISAGQSSALIQWGGTGPDDFFFYGYSEGAEATFTGNWTKGIDLTQSGGHLRLNNAYNTLTVRKQGDFYQFFMNEQPFDVFDFLPFYGNTFAFYIGPHTTMRVDYLRISSIN